MTHAWLAAIALAAVSVGWLDPYGRAREAARLYAAGKYDDAVARYNEALIDQSDSALLHFNLGDAAYKQGRYTDAVNAFQQTATGSAEPARAAYNLGNAKYRLGEAAESSDPKTALGLYAEALVAYRRALGAAPDDVDAKFNHEFVEKKIADLKKKLEEQQKSQEQQPQDQQKQDQQPQQQGEQKPDDQRQQDEQRQQARENASESAGEKRERPGDMTRQEATGLLDSQRDQEVQPDEVTKRAQGVVVGEPAQDW